MIPAKEEVRRLLELLPDDVSLEDIQYHIYVRQKIDRGLEDIKADRTISEEELGQGHRSGSNRKMDGNGHHGS